MAPDTENSGKRIHARPPAMLGEEPNDGGFPTGAAPEIGRNLLSSRLSKTRRLTFTGIGTTQQ